MVSIILRIIAAVLFFVALIGIDHLGPANVVAGGLFLWVLATLVPSGPIPAQ